MNNDKENQTKYVDTSTSKDEDQKHPHKGTEAIPSDLSFPAAKPNVDPKQTKPMVDHAANAKQPKDSPNDQLI